MRQQSTVIKLYDGLLSAISILLLRLEPWDFLRRRIQNTPILRSLSTVLYRNNKHTNFHILFTFAPCRHLEPISIVDIENATVKNTLHALLAVCAIRLNGQADRVIRTVRIRKKSLPYPSSLLIIHIKASMLVFYL
jgi:hypothetical protein